MTASADFSLTFEDPIDIRLPQPLSVNAGITEIPKLSIGLDPPSIAPLSVNAGITEIPKLSIGLAQLTIEPLTITVKALALAIGITEFRRSGCTCRRTSRLRYRSSAVSCSARACAGRRSSPPSRMTPICASAAEISPAARRRTPRRTSSPEASE